MSKRKQFAYKGNRDNELKTYRYIGMPEDATFKVISENYFEFGIMLSQTT